MLLCLHNMPVVLRQAETIRTAATDGIVIGVAAFLDKPLLQFVDVHGESLVHFVHRGPRCGHNQRLILQLGKASVKRFGDADSIDETAEWVQAHILERDRYRVVN